MQQRNLMLRFFVLMLVWLAVIEANSVAAQQNRPGHWQLREPIASVSLRGVSVVDHQTIWASGAESTVLRSLDGGKSFSKVSVGATGKHDFRDLHAHSAKRVSLMNAGQPARFYFTDDGGEHWQLAYECTDKRAFFDAMEFWDSDRGIAFSDPIDGRLLIITTRDGGKSWQPLAPDLCPKTDVGEHGYAASGSCLTVLPGLDSVVIRQIQQVTAHGFSLLPTTVNRGNRQRPV